MGRGWLRRRCAHAALFGGMEELGWGVDGVSVYRSVCTDGVLSRGLVTGDGRDDSAGGDSSRCRRRRWHGDELARDDDGGGDGDGTGVADGAGDAGLACAPSPAGAITKLGRQRARFARAVTKADALSPRTQPRQRLWRRPTLNKTMGTAARVGLFVALAMAGCAAPPARVVLVPALRVSEFSAYGPPARRAATRLVLQGLAVDAPGRAADALSRYERALQIDPENAFAYLALARHEAFGGEPARALAFLDKAEANLRALARAGALDWALVTPHLTGLRAAAARRTDALALPPGLASPSAPRARGALPAPVPRAGRASASPPSASSPSTALPSPASSSPPSSLPSPSTSPPPSPSSASPSSRAGVTFVAEVWADGVLDASELR